MDFEDSGRHAADSTRERIIAAAVDILRGGSEKVTVRMITSSAGVNVSAVNYYFGSLDALLDVAGSRIFSDMRGLFDLLRDDGSPAKDRLRRFVSSYFERLRRCSGMLFKTLYRRMFVVSGQEAYFDFVRSEGFELMRGVVSEITGETDRRRLDVLFLQVFMGILAPALAMDSLGCLAGVEFPSVGDQVDVLVSHLHVGAHDGS